MWTYDKLAASFKWELCPLCLLPVAVSIGFIHRVAGELIAAIIVLTIVVSDTYFSVGASAVFLRPITNTMAMAQGQVQTAAYKGIQRTKYMTLAGASLAVFSSTALYANMLAWVFVKGSFVTNPWLNFTVFGANLDSILNDIGRMSPPPSPSPKGNDPHFLTPPPSLPPLPHTHHHKPPLPPFLPVLLMSGILKPALDWSPRAALQSTRRSLSAGLRRPSVKSSAKVAAESEIRKKKMVHFSSSKHNSAHNDNDNSDGDRYATVKDTKALKIVSVPSESDSDDDGDRYSTVKDAKALKNVAVPSESDPDDDGDRYSTGCLKTNALVRWPCVDGKGGHFSSS
jgi:hypothetical protein